MENKLLARIRWPLNSGQGANHGSSRQASQAVFFSHSFRAVRQQKDLL